MVRTMSSSAAPVPIQALRESENVSAASSARSATAPRTRAERRGDTNMSPAAMGITSAHHEPSWFGESNAPWTRFWTSAPPCPAWS